MAALIDHSVRIALYQPEIAGNVGAILRLAACFNIAVDLIEPIGFPYSSRALARAGMDYAAHVDVTRHPDWPAFRAAAPGRIVLFTTAGDTRFDLAQFHTADTLLMGSESAGVPAHVHDDVDMRVRIPLVAGRRSLNVAVATGMALAEAMKQTGGYPA